MCGKSNYIMNVCTKVPIPILECQDFLKLAPILDLRSNTIVN